MKKLIFLLMLLLVSCSTNNGESLNKTKVEDQEVAVTRSNREILAENLNVPWSINKINDTFYINERPGSIMKIQGDIQSRQKVIFEKPLATAAEAGFLGFILAPDFSESKRAYAYYTYEDKSGQFNRIITLKLENDVWKEELLLLDRIPSGQYHHGGRLDIGPDHKLYVTTGDAATKPEIAQDVKSLGGKILRMNLDGTVPADNPFPNSYVYSYGHRNPQGLAWSKNNTLYESEHGPTAFDEINEIKAGQNYGWPYIKGEEERAGMETPLFHSGENDTWAPSGMAYENGKLYVATLRGEAIREIDLETGEIREVIKGLGRIRDVFVEKGTLYFVSNNTDGRGTPDETDDKLYMMELEEL